MSEPSISERSASKYNPLTKWIRIGDYPAEYDPVKHGPYNPSRYYGPPDTPFGELKLREIPAWIMRRKKGPRELASLWSRAFWRWDMTWMQPRKASAAPIYQILFASCSFFYILNYLRIRGHRNYKYH